MGIGTTIRKGIKGWFRSDTGSNGKARTRRRQTLDIVETKGSYNQLGYHSARVAGREGRTATGGSGNLHQRIDRPLLINQSREFHRDNGIYTGLIEQAVNHIIDDGFKLQVTTPDKDLNAEIESRWLEFWENPEIKNILTGEQTEQMVAREVFLCGDTGVILDQSGKIQLIEAEQIARKATNDTGIETDSVGRPIRYYVSPYRESGEINITAATSHDPEFFLFLTDPRRPSALRSVPPCEAAFPMLHRINDVCDSEAQAWQLLARLALSVTRKDSAEAAYAESITDPEKQAGEQPARVMELDYATIFNGDVGEEIKGVERNIPGQNFTESLVMFLRLLGLPLGIPLELVLLDWTKSNYSQCKAVLQQAHKTFRSWQKLIRNRFHNPILRWKLMEWDRELKVKSDMPIRWNWIMPVFPWLDELKEAQAWGYKLERGFSTHGHACKSLGLERDEVVAARAAEVTEAINLAKQIKTETGTEVPWQIFAGLKAETSAAGRPGGSEPSSGPEKDVSDTSDNEDTGDDEE